MQRRGQGQIPGATCHHRQPCMSPGPRRAGPPRNVRQQAGRHHRDPVPGEGGLRLPERCGEGSRGACAAWDVLLGTLLLPTRSPKADSPSRPVPPVELTPLGRLKWPLEPPWAFFDPQRAEGEAGLFRAAPFLEPQCHQAESFSARPSGPVPGERALAGRPAVVGRVGLGHGELTGPGTGRPPAPLQRGRRSDRGRASSLTCPPSRPGLPGPCWGRGLGSRHVPTQAGDAPGRGRLAHDRHPRPPSERGPGRPGTRGPDAVDAGPGPKRRREGAKGGGGGRPERGSLFHSRWRICWFSAAGPRPGRVAQGRGTAPYE